MDANYSKLNCDTQDDAVKLRREARPHSSYVPNELGAAIIRGIGGVAKR